MGVIIALVIIGGLVWLIDGRSPQAIVVSHALNKSTMEDYERNKRDKMGHVYPLWPCPEGSEARKVIAQIITQ